MRNIRYVAFVVSILTTLLTPLAGKTADVAGIKFEDKTKISNTDLALNGAGLRTRLIFKVYAIALYLPVQADSADAVLASPGPKKIEIVTLRELSPEQLADALVDGLRKNHDKAALEKLETRVEAFRATMLAIGVSPGNTRIRLEYVPQTGTRLFVGAQQKGTDIPGEDFFQALLRIWLGEQPAQEDLKAQLLGRK